MQLNLTFESGFGGRANIVENNALETYIVMGHGACESKLTCVQVIVPLYVPCVSSTIQYPLPAERTSGLIAENVLKQMQNQNKGTDEQSSFMDIFSIFAIFNVCKRLFSKVMDRFVNCRKPISPKLWSPAMSSCQ